jgi:hypothetical protein
MISTIVLVVVFAYTFSPGSASATVRHRHHLAIMTMIDIPPSSTLTTGGPDYSKHPAPT